MLNCWEEWVKTNYKYILLGFANDQETQNQIHKIAEACEKHGVSLKTFVEILQEIGNE